MIETVSMSIADLLKYAEQLKERYNSLVSTNSRMQTTRTGVKVLASNADGSQVVEETTYVLSPKAMMSEIDLTAKEMRLVRQKIEELNHTTRVEFTTQF